MARRILPIVIALIPIAVASRALVNSDRHRQMRTMADMESIGRAWEARATDFNSYSVTSRRGRVTTAELARALEPRYIAKLPRADGWGTEFQLTTTDYDSDGRAGTYIIRSLGSDRTVDRISTIASGPTRNPADDLIFSNGVFVRYPERAG
jgi:hypothetical protein